MTKITAIIPTFNEDTNIQRALDSVLFADEIIVIDSYSTDLTLDIVKKRPDVTIIQRVFDDFSTQKNYAIQLAQHDWIFLLDADEEVPLCLRDEILKTVANAKKDAYVIGRNFYFKKQRIRFGGFQRGKVTRLFLKQKSIYKGKVHEKLIVTGDVGLLKHKLNHYSFKNYKHYKSKLKTYAELQALELLEEQQRITLFHTRVKPIARFCIHYVFRLGVLDGIPGIIMAYLHSWGVYRRYIELQKLRR